MIKCVKRLIIYLVICTLVLGQVSVVNVVSAKKTNTTVKPKSTKKPKSSDSTSSPDSKEDENKEDSSSEGKGRGKNGISDDKMRSLVTCSKSNFNKIIGIIDVLHNDGFSDAAIAGMLGNAWQESHWSPLNEGLYGLCDTYSAWTSSKQYEECTHKKAHNDGDWGTMTWCETGVCTSVHAWHVLKSRLPTSNNVKKFSKFMKAHGKDLKKIDTKNFVSWKEATEVNMQGFTCNNIKDFKAMDDAGAAAACWLLVFEIANGVGLGIGLDPSSNKKIGWEDRNTVDSDSSGNRTYLEWFAHEFCTKYNKKGKSAPPGRCGKANQLHIWLGGGGGKATSDNTEAAEEAKAVAEQLVSSGYWTEEQLSNYIKMSELPITALEEATKENLEQEDSEAINSMSDWKDDIEKNEEDGGLLHILRSIVSFIGILFTVWVILIYLAFWFDRVNSIYDFSFLGLLTFGRLILSPEDDDCTFKLRDIGKSEKRTVNHKAILEICIIGMIFGVAVITGAIYSIVFGIINLAFRILGNIF